MLMDKELPDADRHRIRAIAMANAGVQQVHDLRTRASGRMVFIQLHLEMNGAMTLEEAHVVADSVEAEIIAAFPGAEVMIHEDPAGVQEKRARFA